MAQKLTSTQVLLNEYIKKEYAENPQYQNEGNFFEFFAAAQVLKERDLSDEEIEAGICGTAQDGGCDSCYLFIDEILINDDTPLDQFKRNVNIDFYIIQAKNNTSFNETVFDKWKTTCSNLLDMDNDINSFRDRYNYKVRHVFEMFRNARMSLVRKSPKVRMFFCYVTKGTSIHPNVEAQSVELKKLVKESCSDAVVSIDFIGSEKIWGLVNKIINNEFQLTLSENPVMSPSSKVFVALVKLRDYYKFMINENQELTRHIFEANVRDYQGKVAVNKDIQESLETQNEENFWWLNNGATIIASDAKIAFGKTLIINDPEIVNGLQTSTEIFNYFKKHPTRLENDDREILVRIIVPESEASRDRIIFATNNQTPIQKSSLRATDVIHRHIESYFKNRELYYDRRKNFYKNNNKKSSQIVSLPFLSQCLISVLMKRPNDARARPSTLLKDDQTYNNLYGSDQLELYYNIAVVGKRVEAVLKKAESYSITQISDIKFYVLFTVFAKILKRTSITGNEVVDVLLDDITEDFIIQSANMVFEIYQKLGGDDRVAKSQELITELIKDLQIEFNFN